MKRSSKGMVGLVGITILFSAATAMGADKTAPAAQKPGTSTEGPAWRKQIAFLMGDWSCKGKAEASQMGPAHPTSSKIHVEQHLDDYWLHLTMQEDPDKANPHPVRVDGFWGYDSAGKQLVRLFATNFGGWGNATSPGLKDNTIVWLGEIKQGDGRMLPLRHTITKQSDTSYRDQFEVREGDKWVVRAGSSCTKR